MGKKVHASLFSGFGAADLAATWMGWDNAFWCEIDNFPRRVLGYWFPESIGYGNIKETDFTEWKGKIDVLTGGFPCQPFSVAGRRKGKEDDRYLWPEMLRAIREIRPTWIVGENVAGILSMVQPGREAEVEHQAALFEATDKETILEQEYVVETICRDIEQEGYTIQPIVIPACAVGAPHRRDRVFFIAHRSDAGTEGLQCEGENGTDQPPVTSDTNSKRCDDWSDNWEKRLVCHNEERDTQENKSKRAERKCRTCKNGEIVTYFLSTFKEGAYETEDLSTGFSMPYEVYKKFREQICLMAHGVRPTEIWSNIENWEGKPFVEFISFSGTGGSFDYLIAEKLYKDFSDFKEKVKQDIPDWYDSYCAYMDILKIASDNKGGVCYL